MERTAYPRFKRVVSAPELEASFTHSYARGPWVPATGDLELRLLGTRWGPAGDPLESLRGPHVRVGRDRPC